MAEMKKRPISVLEIGCGNSGWLPYFGRKEGFSVAGIDYSPEGCDLARRRLEVEGLEGRVICGDIFELSSEEVGQYDFVFSLGVVEHFSETASALQCMRKFVRPGGILLTQIPNFVSMHGVLSWLYHPEQLRKHKILMRKHLLEAYRCCGFTDVRTGYVGLSSLTIVSWGRNQRFPKLDSVLLLWVRRVIRIHDKILVRLGRYSGFWMTAPFIYAVGTKPRTSLSAS